ncbi:hypothetical protein CCACVL1_05610 [Corchorus capsularis]|uniref:DUF7950 domain-containing protein n=1 Tax=Corchorus capsularis TaxID=210143 RepID=A0A1R3JJP4_COCAP|nr:hypothetical protein CCACVL1_05610 [Corchorus capsularis]
MESRGGCCIARYAASGVYDMSKVDRIMLRFRPIAPKPVTGESVSPRENSDVYCKSGRGKRRQSKESNNINGTKRCNRKRRALSDERKVTLPLLPEAPDCKDSIFKEEKKEVVENIVPVWLNFGQAHGQKNGFHGGGVAADRAVVMAAAPQTVRVVWSCVTVECVTETWVSGDGLGSTDEERKVNLGKDTCPGFISDGLGRVTWTNGAYKEMVGGVGGETMVWLVMKERLPMITYPALTCRVRVQQYTCGKESSSLTLPCDVWRMDGGGFAWRLDINAALSLGR